MNFKKVFEGVLGKKYGALCATTLACRTGHKNTVALLHRALGVDEPGNLPTVLISAPESAEVREAFPGHVVEYSQQKLIAERYVREMYEQVEDVLRALRTHNSTEKHVAITLQADVLRDALAGIPDGDSVQVVIARDAIQIEALHDREKIHAVMGVYHGAGDNATVIALRGDAVPVKKFDGQIPHAVPRRKVAAPVEEDDDLFEGADTREVEEEDCDLFV